MIKEACFYVLCTIKYHPDEAHLSVSFNPWSALPHTARSPNLMHASFAKHLEPQARRITVWPNMLSKSPCRDMHMMLPQVSGQAHVPRDSIDSPLQ